MSYRYWEHLKELFSGYQGKGELDIAVWSKGGAWKDNFRAPGRVFESIRKTYKPRARAEEMMLSCSTSFFTPASGGKNSASQANVSDIYEILFDIDNDEFKQGKDQYTDPWALEGFLKETKKKLWDKVRETLDTSGLLPYATCIDTGSGVHVHFFLKDIVDYNQPLKGSTGVELPVKDLRDAIVSMLVTLLGADPLPSELQAKGKWVTEVPYTKVKLDVPVLVDVLHDAREFLGILDLYDKVLMIRERINVDGPSQYVGILNEYIGQREWKNGDTSTIHINRDFRMWLEEDTGKKDKDGNPITNFRPIHSSYAVIPKYVIFPPSESEGDEQENGLFIAEAVNSKDCRTIKLPQSAFEAPDKLQKYFVKSFLDLAVERNRRQLFSYFLTHSKRIASVEVGRHEDMLVMYDYIYKYGQKWPARKNIVEIRTPDGVELYYIQGSDQKRELEKSPGYSREHPVTEGIIDGVLERMDRIIRDGNKSRLFMSYLATTLIRDKVISHYKEMPNLNLFGEPGTGKTTFLDAACRIFNIREQTAHPTKHHLYRKQRDMKNMIIALDDISDLGYYQDFLKDSVRPTMRSRRMENGEVDSPEIRNSLIITTNYAITDQAVNNRMLKLFFSKDGIIEDVRAYSEFDTFVDEYQLSILTALYEKVSQLDFKDIKQAVDTLTNLAGEKLRDIRLAKMYSIVLAVGTMCGIIEDPAAYMLSIAEVESYSLNEKEELLEVMVDYAIKEATENGISPSTLSTKTAIKVSKLTKFLEDIKYDKFVTQKTVAQELAPYRSFIIRKRTTVQGQGNGVFYMVDFSHPVFRPYFDEVSDTLVRLKDTRREDADYSPG